MAQVQVTKKGGRYTEKEKEERRIQVYHLHFEENKPATKIAELLNVNRNTINDDIHYWNQQISNEFKAQDLTAKMTKQIQRMEIQRDRLLDDLEEAENLNEKIRIERFISDIDNRLLNLYYKMKLNGKTRLETTAKIEDITEDEIKFIRELVLIDDDSTDFIYSENSIMFEFIRKTKCDIYHAKKFIKKLREGGLELCIQSHEESGYFQSVNDGSYSQTYNLIAFAYLRGFVSSNEFDSIMNKISKIRENDFNQQLEQKKEKEAEFFEKYGPKSNWPIFAKLMFDYNNEPF